MQSVISKNEFWTVLTKLLSKEGQLCLKNILSMTG